PKTQNPVGLHLKFVIKNLASLLKSIQIYHAGAGVGRALFLSQSAKFPFLCLTPFCRYSVQEGARVVVEWERCSRSGARARCLVATK
ncbi:MAG: hypothetical protein ACKO96_09200, partial [Flammeovirgaceae bacterium]